MRVRGGRRRGWRGTPGGGARGAKRAIVFAADGGATIWRVGESGAIPVVIAGPAAQALGGTPLEQSCPTVSNSSLRPKRRQECRAYLVPEPADASEQACRPADSTVLRSGHLRSCGAGNCSLPFDPSAGRRTCRIPMPSAWSGRRRRLCEFALSDNAADQPGRRARIASCEFDHGQVVDSIDALGRIATWPCRATAGWWPTR